MHKILGSDGNEYNSISAEKIKQWIRENRVEKKTPVMPKGVDDWIFLGELPEFAGAFAASQKSDAVAPAQKRRGRTAVYLVLLLLAVTAAIFIFIMKNAEYH